MKLKFIFSFLFSFLLISAFFIKPALADTVILSGNVQDSSGNAVSGATITVNDANNDGTTTDSSGNYSLALPSGTYNVQVNPPSGSSFSSIIAYNQSISTNTVLNFVFAPVGSVTFSGQVVDAQGNAVANQQIQFSDSNNNSTYVTTDTSGDFSFTGQAGTYNVYIRNGNSSSDFSQTIPSHYELDTSISLTQSTTSAVITLPAKQVTVHIQDASGNPVSGVNVSDNFGGSGASVPLGSTLATASISYANDYPGPVTDSSGNATLWLYPGNGYSLTATPPSGSVYSTTTVSSINIMDNTTETITMEQPVTFSGQVVDAQGNAVANQQIQLELSSGGDTYVTTDSSGNFSFTGQAGDYRVFIRNENSSNDFNQTVPSHYELDTNLSLTQSVTDAVITLPAKQVTVHVKDVSGNPVSGATVSDNFSGSGASVPLGDTLATASIGYSNDYPGPVTDSSGNATLWLFPGNGYSLTATPTSGSYSTTTVSNINITDNTDETITMEQPVTFSGHFVDSQGNAATNLEIQFESNSGNSTYVDTDSSGNFSFTGQAGTYNIYLRDKDSTYNSNQTIPSHYELDTNLSLTQSVTDAVITLPAKQVTVHVQDASGNPISGATVRDNYSGSGASVPLGDTLGTASIAYSNDYPGPVTDDSGNATLWLFPGNGYSLTAIPTSGSVYSTFTVNDINITQNQTEIISLQYSHNPPTTIATLSPSPFSDGMYSDPTTVTLSASAASGYTVANTYYTIDGGSHQTYSAPFTVTGTGSHTITYWSADNSGVTEATNTKTFTITEAYSLTGTVYNDANQNGFQDTGEHGYAGATVSLNTGQTTTTDSNGNYTFSNLESGTYTEDLTLPNGYMATTTNPVSVPLAANTTVNFGIAQQNSLVTAINAGGATQGNYVADTDYSGGTTFSSSDAVDTSAVANPAPQAVYQTVRYGNFSYTIPNLTANGTYTIQLHFSEPYWGTSQAGGGGVGSRIFNVSVNGTQELSDFDVYQTAGGANKAVMEQIPATADSNGNITVSFNSVVDNAMVSGIAVYTGTLPSPTPTPTPTPVSSLSISAGGPGAGSYVADTDYIGGTTYNTSATIDTSGVTDPAPQAVYQNVRYGNSFSYTIPTNSPNTNYTVRLDFSEPYFNSAGQREFNVTINGTQDLSNFDVYQAAGGENKAVSETFNTTSDSNGLINIQFNSVIDNAMVSGIEVSQQ